LETSGLAAMVSGLVKQERVPSWHTRPSPSTWTLQRTVSLSQSVSAGFALGPERVPCAAVKRHVAGLERFVERFLVHESHHEDFAAIGILHDGRGKAPHFLEIDLHCPVPRLDWSSCSIHAPR